jgi:putative PIN family toxin of toxin-antitoxin system
MVEAPRVVLDTNTVLAALLFVKGRLLPLRTAWQSGAMPPLLCVQTAQELLRVLAYPKFKLTPEDREELLADNLPFGEVVAPWKKSPMVPACRDKHDRVFLELASVGAAEWLVTGDQDLSRLSGRVKFEIIAPAAAVGLLTSSR